MRSTLKQKQQAYLRGQKAEDFAALYLRVKGYHILKRRLKTPLGEIDILAQKGNTFVAIEVKARDTFAEAAFSLTLTQERRIERALTYYLSGRPDQPSIRFDVILIAPWRWPQHIVSAWRAR